MSPLHESRLRVGSADRGRGVVVGGVIVTFAALSLVCTIVPTLGSSVGVADVKLFVRSQNTARDRGLVSELKASVVEAGWSHRSVVSMAEEERERGHSGLWSYKPWIYALDRRLARRRSVTTSGHWFVFLEPTTAVDPAALQSTLDEYDVQEPLFLGYKLRDKESSIIHHYNDRQSYPHVHAGFAMSGALFRKLAQELKKKPLPNDQQIEPVFELARWVASVGVELTDRSDRFCAVRKPSCALWASPRPDRGGPAFAPLSPQDVVIAVKTVGKFHSTRVALAHEIWGAQSDVEVFYLSNEAYSGVDGAQVVDLSPEFGRAVDPKIESTKQGSGHCSKMSSILQYLAKHRPGKRWYVVTDDDTLLNVPRLLVVLNSHDDRVPLYLGERYGWGHRERDDGTNYVTTGGGMALSGPALAKVVECSHCTCGKPNAPDDMALGQWFRGLSVQIVHEEGFHQSEPHNYHPEVLASSDPPISFHRYASHLPSNTPEAKVQAKQRSNWRKWQKEYFEPPFRRKAQEL